MQGVRYFKTRPFFGRVSGAFSGHSGSITQGFVSSWIELAGTHQTQMESSSILSGPPVSNFPSNIIHEFGESRSCCAQLKRNQKIQTNNRGLQEKPNLNRQTVSEHIIEIVSDSGEGAQKAGQSFGSVSAKMGNGVWTVEIIPAEIKPLHAPVQEFRETGSIGTALFFHGTH